MYRNGSFVNDKIVTFYSCSCISARFLMLSIIEKHCISDSTTYMGTYEYWIAHKFFLSCSLAAFACLFVSITVSIFLLYYLSIFLYFLKIKSVFFISLVCDYFYFYLSFSKPNFLKLTLRLSRI